MHLMGKKRALQTRTNTQKFSPKNVQVGNLKAHGNKWHIVRHLTKLIIGIHYIWSWPLFSRVFKRVLRFKQVQAEKPACPITCSSWASAKLLC